VVQDPESKENARCRNSNLNEDLGKIDYIFSDKTGTLTSNEMRLRMIAIKGLLWRPSRVSRRVATGIDAAESPLADSLQMIQEKSWPGYAIAYYYRYVTHLTAMPTT
jgi:magnesium-transporting ATPase (P-type)